MYSESIKNDEKGVIPDDQKKFCRVETKFVGAGCAVRPNVLEWCPRTGLVFYAAHTDICCVETVGENNEGENDIFPRVFATVPANSTEIVVLKRIQNGVDFSAAKDKNERSINGQDESLLCSCSSTGEVKLWRASRDRDKSSPLCCLKTVCTKLPAGGANAIAGQFFAGDGGNWGVLAYSQFDRLEYRQIHLKGENINDLKGEEENSTADDGKSPTSIQFQSLIISVEMFSTAEKVLFLFVGLANGSVEVFATEIKADMKCEFKRVGVIKSAQIQWIRALAVRKGLSEGQFLLAASNDNCIKIWTFTDVSKMAPGERPKPRMDTFVFELFGGQMAFVAKLDTVLGGTERQFRSLRWDPLETESLRLLSASNANVIVWEFQRDTETGDETEGEGVWTPRHRIGDVGGDDAGYFGAVWGPCGDRLLFHNYHGAFDCWRLNDEKGEERGGASPMLFPVSGHFAPVTDVAWDPSGSFLLSTGLDKTTRVFAPYKRGGGKAAESFVELARPQIHGHDLTCVAPVSSAVFVSGGEEKIFRVFQATPAFVQNLRNISGVELEIDPKELAHQNRLIRPPELGLSNQEVALEVDDDENGEGDDERSGGEGCGLKGIRLENLIFKEPPRGEQLAQLTLFPELHKLYGHGYEVFAIAANHAGTLLATACKASHPEHAAILLWTAGDWQLRGSLRAHQLTVTNLAFSPNDRWLLSASRDRTWALFRCSEEGPQNFELLAVGDKKAFQNGAHSRIIWACAWAPDSRHFATASRDKSLKIWATIEGEVENEEKVRLETSYAWEQPLTAVDIAPRPIKVDGKGETTAFLVAIGDEMGLISLLTFSSPAVKGDSSAPELILIHRLDHSQAHSGGAVARLRFRPESTENDGGGKKFLLASAGASHIVKIHQIEINFNK